MAKAKRKIKKHGTRPMSPALIEALNHPIRRLALRLLHEDLGHSASDLAKSIAAGLSNISYHMKVLYKLGVIRYTGMKQVRGATERSYASQVAENKLALTILAATEQDDEAMRRAK
jgi:DNA-binding transcriptional ArsR family regulator